MKKNFDAAIHAYIRASLCVFEAPLEAKKKFGGHEHRRFFASGLCCDVKAITWSKLEFLPWKFERLFQKPLKASKSEFHHPSKWRRDINITFPHFLLVRWQAIICATFSTAHLDFRQAWPGNEENHEEVHRCILNQRKVWPKVVLVNICFTPKTKITTKDRCLFP